jgi:molybdenum cofactor biosynthesis protein B
MSQSAHGKPEERAFRAMGVAILTVSDTRSLAEDRSGQLLQEGFESAGHAVEHREVVADEVAEIQRATRAQLARPEVHTVVVTGGTGMTPRDVTPEALEPLFDKSIPGFGELFRMLSWKEIGTAMMQSRACAGLAGGKVVWALPGSTGACRLALKEILLPQLDSRTKPCSVSSLLFC